MAAGSIQGVVGNGSFSQAVAAYAANGRHLQNGAGSPKGKSIAEFSEKEWDKLLERVDSYLDEYKEDIREREEEALKQRQEQRRQGQEDRQDWLACMVGQGQRNQSIRFGDKGAKAGDAPYSALADSNGMIVYQGVAYQCDYENNRLCLGDVSDPGKCLSIPLEKGGCLVVNRDCIDALAKSIGMFSPADINRILRAISQDAKLRQMQYEIEEETSGVRLAEAKERVENESEE